MKSTHTLIALSWVLQIVAAAILLQTLFFKFTAAPESVYIFTTLHAEPWGRIGSGVAELVASLLLLVPATAALGAALAVAVIAGAIASHLAILGIEVQGDGGLLFGLAVVVLVAGVGILLIRRCELPVVGIWLRANSLVTGGQLSRPWSLADPRRRGKSSERPDANGLRLSSMCGAAAQPDRRGRPLDLGLTRLAPPRGRLRDHGQLN